MKSQIIFYSWQSDLPNNSNRGFILDALEKATKRINNDANVEQPTRVDRDTQGIPGAPDIANSIFKKIENSDVFVADVSFITISPKGRKIPNPNVLIELGYALKSLGPERVLMVLNTSTGDPEDLPFDLKMRRPVTYSFLSGSNNRAVIKKQLENKFNVAIIEILNYAEQRKSALPDIKIKPQLAVAARGSRTFEFLILKVQNRSEKPVFLNSIGFTLRNGDYLFISKDFITGELQKKRELKEGQGFDFHIDPKMILAKVNPDDIENAVISDDIERTYTGDPEEIQRVIKTLFKDQ